MTPPARVHVVVLLGGECMRSYRGTTTGLKPGLQLHSPTNRVYCPRLHARGSGYFLRAVGSRVRSQGTNLTSHVRHRAPQVASRIALCTRPPTTHSRGASGHTSWIRPTCKQTIGLSPQFSRQGAGRVSARASARAPSNATAHRSKIIQSHPGRAAPSSSIL